MTMTKIELNCAIMHEFNVGNLESFTTYGINVEWSKTLRIGSICEYGVKGLYVVLYDKKGHYVCEKKVTDNMPKKVLQSILDELTK